jgi:hypothetical protein
VHFANVGRKDGCPNSVEIFIEKSFIDLLVEFRGRKARRLILGP